MDSWIKSIWALAAIAVVACLISLGHSTGGPASTAAVGPPANPSGHYFTMRDPVRGMVEYGVREGQTATIYSSLPAR